MAQGVRALPGKIEFNRPPRIRSGLSRTRVEVPAAPPMPHKPASSLASGLIIPIVVVAAMSGVFLVASGSADPGQRSLMLLAGAGLLVGSALAPAWAFFEDRRRFRHQIARQQDEYARRLNNLEPELSALREEEFRLRLADDPALDVMLERARTRDRRLWERRPQDADFLAVRLGLGPTPSVLEVAHREDSDTGPNETSPLLSQLMALRRESAQLAERHRHIADVPIRADLKAVGALGIVGSRKQTAAVARSILCQAAGLHSPDDLQIAAVLGEDSVADWTWLKWLPHVRQSRIGDTPPLLAWNAAGRADLSRWLLDELTGRKRVLSEVSAYDVAQVNLAWILLFVDDVAALRADPALKLALAEGKRLRVATICTTDDRGQVPGACGGVALLDPRPDGLLTYVLAAAGSQAAEAPTQCVPDIAQPQQAEALARALAPIVVAQDATRDQGLDIPSRVSFFEALDLASVERLDVTRWWQLGAPSALLKVALGPKAGGEMLTLDLKEQGQGGHGPHGLVAGTTGAGKSELLLTMIAGLALRHPPDVLTFVLIDYKGGEAFKAVADLPHTVALITDLDRHLAQRALETLRSEIKRRERRMLELRGTGIGSLAEYQSQRSLAGPMPFLAIIVDEFARLKDELPEFISGLIDVARVGRSLGVHLILATQTPSGTVDDQIQKNTSFALCLRVQDQSDSRQVLGVPDAALLPGTLPGRAYFRSGLSPVQLFQTARVGGTYRARDLNEPLEVQAFPPEARPHPGVPHPVSTREVSPVPHGQPDLAGPRTEIDALVQRLRAAAEAEGLVAPRWPDPLADRIALVDLDGAGGVVPAPTAEGSWRWSSPPADADWLAAPVGLVDEPSHQSQRPYYLDVSRNCIVYGAAGSGKSTLLRTFAASLALSHAPQDLAMYCLDFGARTLGPLAGLPQVADAGVFFPRDTVRIRRLFRQLEHEVIRRREAGVTNLKQQRALGSTFGAAVPFMLVLLDNYAAFRETFEEEEEQTRSGENILGDLATLMRDGPAVGIHFIVTATAPGSIHSTIVNGAETRLTLRQIDPSDYTIVGRFERPPERVPPGRGFATGTPPREFQVALLPDDFSDLAEQPHIEGELFNRLRASAGEFKPFSVQDLPTWLPLDDERLRTAALGASGRLPCVLGLDDETSQPLVVDLDDVQHLVVAGPPGSGKTSLLACCLSQLLESHAGTEALCFLVLPRPSPLSRRVVDADARWQRVARNVPQLTEILDELEEIVDARRDVMRGESHAEPAAPPPLVLLIDDYELLRQDDDFLDVEIRLARVARRGSSVGLHVLLGGSNVELREARDDLLRYLTQFRVGVLLQPDVEFDGDLFSVRLKRLAVTLPVGRGYFVLRQRQHLFQAAVR